MHRIFFPLVESGMERVDDSLGHSNTAESFRECLEDQRQRGGKNEDSKCSCEMSSLLS